MRTVRWRLAARVSGLLGLVTATAAGQSAPFVWADSTPTDCPFPRSTHIEPGVGFTGRHVELPDSDADTWYPSWAADGALYSPFADGAVNGVAVDGYHDTAQQRTGNARITGDDPMHLKLEVISTVKNDPTPYAGRYPSASLVYNGVWYYGTYTLDDQYGPCQNWCVQGPFIGFRQSTDGGNTWKDTTHKPDSPLFGETGKNGSKVKFGAIHMVDFGKNMERSPDGRAYFVSNGPSSSSGLVDWIAGDAVYLGRVTPTPENMDNNAAFEFFSGDPGADAWSKNVADAKPIALWPGKLGNVSVTYDAPLHIYLMWVSRPHDPGKNMGNFDTMLFESSQLTGPWNIVTTWSNFGPQAYFVNTPSKFIGADGKTMWLLYSANYTHIDGLPEGSKYNFGLHEFTFDSSLIPDAGVITGNPSAGGAGGTGATAGAGNAAGAGIISGAGNTAGAGTTAGAAGATAGAGTTAGGALNAGAGAPMAGAAPVSHGSDGCGCHQVGASSGVGRAPGALVLALTFTPLLSRFRRRRRARA